MDTIGQKRRRGKTLEERFWAKVDKTKNCHLWIGSTNPDGYGRFKVDGKLEGAHRVAYELAYGPFDKSLKVLHTCDNPPCVNYLHLFLGTQIDNINDMVHKNRTLRGEKRSRLLRGSKCPRALLDDSSVVKIRELAHRGYTDNELSETFQVSVGSIRAIRTGRQWKDTAGPITKHKPYGMATAKGK